MKGILAALGAMILAGLTQKTTSGTPTSGYQLPLPYPGGGGVTPEPAAPPAGLPDKYVELTPEIIPDINKFGGFEEYKEPLPGGIDVTTGIIETMPASIPEAIADPIRGLPVVKIGGKTQGWTWYTPSGPITSRPPTPEEEESGLGCPEVPGIWDYPMASVVRYCANMECPSNKSEYDYTSHEWLSPTPAQLEQQVDAGGNISYFCRVCRTYQ